MILPVLGAIFIAVGLYMASSVGDQGDWDSDSD